MAAAGVQLKKKLASDRSGAIAVVEGRPGCGELRSDDTRCTGCVRDGPRPPGSERSEVRWLPGVHASSPSCPGPERSEVFFFSWVHRRVAAVSSVLASPRSGGVLVWSHRRGAAVSGCLWSHKRPDVVARWICGASPEGGAERGEGGRLRKRGILLPPPPRLPAQWRRTRPKTSGRGAGGEGGTSNPPQQPERRGRVPFSGRGACLRDVLTSISEETRGVGVRWWLGRLFCAAEGRCIEFFNPAGQFIELCGGDLL